MRGPGGSEPTAQRPGSEERGRAVSAAGWNWGPFTLRLPGLHLRPEWPELVQGLVLAGVTGLAVVPLYESHFGMSFEAAVAMIALQGMIVTSGALVFGEPFCPGWITPALPLVLAEALRLGDVGERVRFTTAVVLSTAAVFLLLGLSRLGPALLARVPRALQAGIILGAGLRAVYGEMVPTEEGEVARLSRYPISILVAVGLTLLLLYSRPFEGLQRRWPWLRRIAALGIAPGFLLAMVVGPWVGEVHYPAGLTSGRPFFWPDFGELFAGFSPFWVGLPEPGLFLRALPLALAAYLVAFGDLVTGAALVREAAEARGDEEISIDERRSHLALGLRNGLAGLLGGPFFPLQGPLWTGAMVVVAERYRRGREHMESIFSGIGSYYLYGVPLLLFLRPVVEGVRPVLPVAFSLTLLLTGFACGYVALGRVRERVEQGVAVLVALVLLVSSTVVGLAVGLVLSFALLGPQAFSRTSSDG